MFHAFQEQLHRTEIDPLSVEERFSLRVDRELIERAHRRLQYRLHTATLHPSAGPQEIDSRHPRGRDKALMQPWLSGRGLDHPLHCLLTGPTGVGKPQPLHYPSR